MSPNARRGKWCAGEQKSASTPASVKLILTHLKQKNGQPPIGLMPTAVTAWNPTS
jgi:hypothetical protein